MSTTESAICHIGGVTVLVLAVARRTADPPIVLGRPEPGMDVDVDIRHSFLAVPARDLSDHELQLVQQFRVYRRVTRPLADLIVGMSTSAGVISRNPSGGGVLPRARSARYVPMR